MAQTKRCRIRGLGGYGGEFNLQIEGDVPAEHIVLIEEEFLRLPAVGEQVRIGSGRLYIFDRGFLTVTRVVHGGSGTYVCAQKDVDKGPSNEG
jgi:hypothetical protein